MEQNKKILVVEDEAVIALDLQNSLTIFGYDVTDIISRGEDVLKSIYANRPDVVLMDIKLEGDLDGIQTAQIIYEEFDIPVIFITSYSNRKLIERAKKTHPFGYIVKPFEDNDLFTNIEIAFYKHQTEIKLRESERKYRELSESIQQIVLECEIDSKISYLNNTGMEILGVTPNKIDQGIYLKDLLKPGQFEKIEKRILSGTDAEKISREYQFKTPKGRELVVEEYLLPVYLNNQIIGLRGVIIDVTERKYFLNKIRESEERFRQIANTVNTAFWIVSALDKKIHFGNPAFRQIYDLDADKLTMDDVTGLIHPDDVDMVKKAFDDGILSGDYKTLYRLVTKKGKIKWIQENAVPIKDIKNRVLRFAFYANEITDRIEAEYELRKSEKVKENILSSMPDSFLRVDKNGVIVNSYFKVSEFPILSSKVRDFVGLGLKMIFSKKISTALLKSIDDSHAQKNIVITQLMVLKKGEKYWFEVRVTEGDENESLLIIRNVSEETKNILELKKFQNITEQTKELILITDIDGRIEYVNPMFTEVTGYNLEEVKGNSPSFFRTNKHSDVFYKSLWETILKGNSFKSQFYNLKKNGEEYIEEKIITPIKNEKGEIVNFISTGRDITNDRKKEDELKSYQKLKRSLEEREQKLRTMAIIQGEERERKRIAQEIHDGLGQMLTVAMTNLNSLNQSSIANSHEIDRIEFAKQVMSEIIQESRRISQNLSPGGLYEFGLFPVLNQTINRLIKNFERTNFVFKSNLENIRFDSDVEINIYRIIQEAIQNTLKHSNAKNIELSLNYKNDILCLGYKDDGVGVDLNEMNKGKKHFNGIRNIQERAKVLDANLKLESMKNKGFELSLCFINNRKEV